MAPGLPVACSATGAPVWNAVRQPSLLKALRQAQENGDTLVRSSLDVHLILTSLRATAAVHVTEC